MENQDAPEDVSHQLKEAKGRTKQKVQEEAAAAARSEEEELDRTRDSESVATEDGGVASTPSTARGTPRSKEKKLIE